MVKFLQVDTAANGNVLINLEHLMFIDSTGTSNTVRFVFSNAYADLDQVQLIFSPSDANPNAEVGSMVDALRKIVIEAAKGSGNEPVVNITSLLPKPVTSMTLN
jgi:ABC-type antimicrobial peptide transport system ATPase subunit